MHTTSPSLLERLRNPEEGEAWPRFVRLVNVDVVYSAKSRVLRRLRQELDGLLD